MDNITLGQIASTLVYLASIIGAWALISKSIKKHIDELFKPFKDDIKEVDKSQCKNYLVRFLKDVEKGTQMSEVEKERAYECYEHYTKDLNCNSYIHDWWDRLMKGRAK